MFAEDIEIEGVDIIVQCFVIEEQFRDQAQILAIGLLILRIHLKD